MITINNFVRGYNAAKEKDEYIKKHIIKDYINYEDKISYCKNIIDFSMYTNTEPKLFKMNTPVKNMCFIITLFQAYTDIDIKFGDHILDSYNLLNKNHIIGNFINVLPESEYLEFAEIEDSMVDDLLTNERDIVSFLETKYKSLELLINSIEIPKE